MVPYDRAVAAAGPICHRYGRIKAVFHLKNDPMTSSRAVRDLVRGLGRAALATVLPAESGALAVCVAGAGGGRSRPVADPAAERPCRAQQGHRRRHTRIPAVRRHAGPRSAPDRAPCHAWSAAPRARPTNAWLAAFSPAIPRPQMYAGFKDFHFYRVAVERAHLVAGFGKIRWLSGGRACAAAGRRPGRRRSRDRRAT